MDARGTEILSLERYIDGVAQKADIFHHPVAFNPNEITEAADAREALVASLNKYAGVNLEYMAGLTGGTKDNILEELHDSIYFNPEINGYEIADKYIAGNVIEKAERVERFLNDNPDHIPAADSLRALREATRNLLRSTILILISVNAGFQRGYTKNTHRTCLMRMLQ